VVKACRKKGFCYVSTLKSNRNLFKNGRKLKAAHYGKGLWRRKGRKHFSQKQCGKPARYDYVDAGILNVGDLGNHRLVYSQKNGKKSTLAIVTNDLKMKAPRMIKTYTERWNIEVFFKDAKQLLGLGQYQNRSYGAAVTHLHLVCFARSLLTHIAISEGAKGKKRNVVRLSCADLQNELRRIVWEDTAAYLQGLPDGNSVIKELGRLLVAA
jgi:SRSO17 transposase